MPKILHTARYTGLPLEILKQACPEGFSVKTLDEATEEQLIKEAKKQIDALINSKTKI